MFHQEGAGERGAIFRRRADLIGTAGREQFLDTKQVQDRDELFKFRGEGQAGGLQIGKQAGLDTLPIGCYSSDE